MEMLLEEKKTGELITDRNLQLFPLSRSLGGRKQMRFSDWIRERGELEVKLCVSSLTVIFSLMSLETESWSFPSVHLKKLMLGSAFQHAQELHL